jgi:hypothetical protein
MVTTCYSLDIKFLTCGNVILTYEQNCIIFKCLCLYQMFKKIPYRITGIELSEHAHHMNPS